MAKLGSIAWQNEMAQNIAIKIMSGKELEGFEETYVKMLPAKDRVLINAMKEKYQKKSEAIK